MAYRSNYTGLTVDVNIEKVINQADFWDAKEPTLGNPTVDGYVLKSKKDGTRYWVDVPAFDAGDKTKLDYITVTQNVDLDAVEGASHFHSNLPILEASSASFKNSMKTKLDYITVTQNVDLDSFGTKFDFIQVTGSIDLDVVKTKTDFLTVTSPIDLDVVKTKIDFLTVTSPVDLDVVKTKIDFLTVTSPVDLDLVKARTDCVNNMIPLLSSNNIVLDMVNSQFSFLADQDFTLQNPINHTPGQVGFISITQDAAGSRAITLGSYYRTENGSAVTLSTNPDSVDVLKFSVLSPVVILLEPIYNLL